LRKIGSELETIAQSKAYAEELTPAQRAKKVIEYAWEEAGNLVPVRPDRFHIGTEHLLLGLLREEESAAGRILRVFGVQLDTLRAEIIKTLKPASEA
jgi:ATP-dependent Clp protease ATP-binding subunit ClpC